MDSGNNPENFHSCCVREQIKVLVRLCICIGLMLALFISTRILCVGSNVLT